MSFLDSVLSSIETGKPASISPATTPRPPPSSTSSSTVKNDARNPSTGARDAPVRGNASVNAHLGTKRKAEEQLQRPFKPDRQVSSKASSAKPVTTSSTASRARLNPTLAASKPASGNTTSTTQKPAAVSSKPPPKGSYADLMAKAKALQDKAPTQVGMFKHQAVTRENLSKAERKRRAMEAQAKGKGPQSGKKPDTTSGSAAGVKSSDGKLIKKREPAELGYKGTSRPSQPPAYRGTAGIPSRRGPDDHNAHSRGGRRRVDEYLGTDEEDEGEDADGYDDYYSESSDMEAGMYDVEEEEALALRSARKEDEKELAAELKHKQEKLERRKKLAELAARRR